MAGVAAATPIFLLFRPNIFTFLNFPSRTEVHRFIHVEIVGSKWILKYFFSKKPIENPRQL